MNALLSADSNGFRLESRLDNGMMLQVSNVSWIELMTSKLDKKAMPNGKSIKQFLSQIYKPTALGPSGYLWTERGLVIEIFYLGELYYSKPISEEIIDRLHKRAMDLTEEVEI